MNNGTKSGLIILFISILGIVFFTIQGSEIPVFFTRFLIVGGLMTGGGILVHLRDRGKEKKEDEGRHL